MPAYVGNRVIHSKYGPWQTNGRGLAPGVRLLVDVLQVVKRINVLFVWCWLSWVSNKIAGNGIHLYEDVL
jgi:hypothetical protein